MDSDITEMIKHLNELEIRCVTDIDDDSKLPVYVKQLLLMFIGVSALQQFVKANVSGPNVEDSNDYTLFASALPDDVTHDDVIQLLSKNGEFPHMNVAQIKLLFLSHMFLSCIPPSEDVCLTHGWWLLRCLLMYQNIMPDKIFSLCDEMKALMKQIIEMPWINGKDHPAAQLIYYIECAQMHLYYDEINLAKNYVTTALSLVGLDIELSGAYGKRTQFQNKAVAQLLVKLKRNGNEIPEVCMDPMNQSDFPADIHLQDDTLLNKVSFVDGEDYQLEHLQPQEQLVLLAYCLLVRKREAFGELLHEEVMTYINCMLSQPKIWSIYMKTLVMRCKLEKNSSRRVERSLMQLEAVINAIKKNETSFSVRETMLYAAGLPMIWSLEKDLADIWMILGGTKSALAIYEKLKLWENIVQCYIQLGRTSCAEKLIREQLTIKETPLLWCLLGDVLDDPEMYEKGDSLACGTNARCLRSLGYYYFKRKDYEKSLPFFQKSLKINSLQFNVCASLGFASLQCKNFSMATWAYRQAVTLDDDNFEAWNNLSNAFIHLKQKDCAWRSLKEALKCNYEEWHVWENFFLVSIDVAAFEDAIRAWHRLLDIKKKFYDPLALKILVQAINNNVKDMYELPASRYRKQVLQLLGRLSSMVTADYVFWEAYASLLCPDPTQEQNLDILCRAVAYQQKAILYASQVEKLDRNVEVFELTMQMVSRLCDLSLVYIERLEEPAKSQQKSAFKLTVSSVLLKVRRYLNECHENHSFDAEKVFNDVVTKVTLVHEGISLF
ncbi:tetratricopeptide repeat protein 27 [Nephila pilipes]|uniref:Tetratricopeptide repeat protein 27 n=1 Tax=Nephila pilipes TaxID=299642 RepID=A0A8X6N6H5_NEPPI|nr:tetratricopeptide repeat protein 27 [Nephila pilipes]